MVKKGKIIVIDGIDGSGKKTQTKLLVERLKKLKKKVITFDFPQYENNFFGKNLKEFLTQEEFKFLQTHPKIASLWYAADRWETKAKIEKHLEQGYFVIFDRYVSSNQIHQGSKFAESVEGEIKRKNFVKWLEILEHKVFKIPKPDVIFYLNLNFQTALNLIKSKNLDVAEKDVEHQKASQRSALKLSKELKNMKVVNCDGVDGGIKSREEINDLIFTQIKKYL